MTRPEPIAEPSESTPEQSAPDSAELEIERRAPRKPPRWTVLVLVLGAALASIPLLSKVPHEREIHLDLGSAPMDGLELTWLDDGELLRQTVLSFDPASPPQRVTTQLNLPNGVYRLQMRIVVGHETHDTFRQIELGSGVTEVTIFVEPPRGR